MSLPNQFEGESTRHWLMFLMRPLDLLRLLRLLSYPGSRFGAGTMPPDVRVADTFFDDEMNLLGAVLESDLFDPVEVRFEDGNCFGDWPRALFSLSQTSDEEPEKADDLWDERAEDLEPDPTGSGEHFVVALKEAIENGAHLRALNFSAAQLLEILRSNVAHQLPLLPVYPEDTRVLGSIANSQIGGWTLFLEHADFEPARAYEDPDEPNMAFIEVPGDGHDMSFRFGLPEAKVRRRIELDPDQLDSP